LKNEFQPFLKSLRYNYLAAGLATGAAGAPIFFFINGSKSSASGYTNNASFLNT
jgi:hypothetical protein